MGQVSRLKDTLLIFTALIAASNIHAEESSKQKSIKAKAISAAESRQWERLLEITKDEKLDGLFQLLQQKARSELERWEDIIAAPAVEDRLFSSYDTYMRALALFEQKLFKAFHELKIPDDLPYRMRQTLSLLTAQAYQAENKLTEAKVAYRKHLKEFPRSAERSDIMLELANIEWKLDNTYEALHLFEKIYTHHPEEDSSDIASQKLKQFGHFQTLGTDAHLTRIKNLQRAALFSKAIGELQTLRPEIGEDQRNRIDLAIANLEFARKRYERSESYARRELSKIKAGEAPKEYLEWKHLLAFSLTRQGKYDLARELYAEILKEEVEPSVRERILLRLGLMAADDKNYDDAAKNFKALRTEFPKGRFQESSHWFEAWSIFQSELEKKKDPEKPVDATRSREAIALLDALPKLPQGERLESQSVYWKSQIYSLLGDEKSAGELRVQLESKWAASFHNLMLQGGSFSALRFKKALASSDVVEDLKTSFKIADPTFQQISWKRVEAFSSVHLQTWAQLEMERFLQRTGKKNKGLRSAVARRLIQLEDWSDLIQYAQLHFDFTIEDLDPEDQIARFYYPQAYHEYVIEASKAYEISPFLIWGVMREESRFQADIMSHAGAVGLLQLMPSLGAQISRKLKEPSVGRMRLTNPSLNVRYGAFHLRELQDRIDRWNVPEEFKIPLVIASYNAGIGPVQRWVQENGTLRLDVFVESIPYTETRNYVKRVLQSANIYYRLYGEKIEKIAETKDGTKL